MTEPLLEISRKYPRLPTRTIEEIYRLWDSSVGEFIERGYEDIHVGIVDRPLSHLDIYQRFNSLWKGKEPSLEEKEIMREHNRQLLEFLKGEFGWKESGSNYYPDPNSIF